MLSDSPLKCALDLVRVLCVDRPQTIAKSWDSKLWCEYILQRLSFAFEQLVFKCVGDGKCEWKRSVGNDVQTASIEVNWVHMPRKKEIVTTSSQNDPSKNKKCNIKSQFLAGPISFHYYRWLIPVNESASVMRLETKITLHNKQQHWNWLQCCMGHPFFFFTTWQL